MRDSGYTTIDAGKVVAHLIEQNWFSKEQVYAEELRSQLAEALPGSVSAMMRAAGFSNEKDFFKAVEAGKIMATDVMPKFADELKKIARTNGALQATTQKTNAQMQRFFNQLTYAKDEIFQNGMDDGLSYMFNSLSIVLKDMRPILNAIAGAFQGFVSVLSGGLRVLLAPIGMLAEGLKAAWALLGVGDKGTQQFWAIAGGAGTIALLALRFDMVRKLLKMINIELMITMSRLLLMAAPLLAIEDLYSTMQGRKTITSSVYDTARSNSLTMNDGFLTRVSAASMKPFQLVYDAFTGKSGPTVTVEVKGDEAAKFIQATVDKSNQARTAVTQTETSQ